MSLVEITEVLKRNLGRKAPSLYEIRPEILECFGYRLAVLVFMPLQCHMEVRTVHWQWQCKSGQQFTNEGLLVVSWEFVQMVYVLCGHTEGK